MLTIVAVNYNNAPATVGLLRSLERQTDGNFDVVVVDNNSSDVDRAALGEYASSGPLRLDVIYSDNNRGFSGGNNIAIRKSLAHGSEWVVLVNNDTTVTPDFIKLLRAQLPYKPALVGIPLREGDPASLTSRGERTTYAGLVRWLKPTFQHVYTLPSQWAPLTLCQRCPLTYVIGAGMAIHRDVFDRVGLLDERYFLYFEDADFSVRACKAGIPIRFSGRPVISHAVSQSTIKLGAPVLLRYHARNALLFNWLHGPWWIRAALPFWSFFGILKQLAKYLTMPSRRHASLAIASGIIDFYAGRFGRIRS